MVILVSFSALFLFTNHISLNVHRQAHDIDATFPHLLLVIRVAHKEAISDRVGSLTVVVLGVDAPANEVLVKLWLLGVKGLALKLIDWSGRVPEWMSFQLVPSDAPHRIFL